MFLRKRVGSTHAVRHPTNNSGCYYSFIGSFEGGQMIVETIHFGLQAISFTSSFRKTSRNLAKSQLPLRTLRPTTGWHTTYSLEYRRNAKRLLTFALGVWCEFFYTLSRVNKTTISYRSDQKNSFEDDE